MKVTRTPDGELHVEDFPAGAVMLTVDDMDGPFGRVPLRLNVQLPDGRVVSVPITPARLPGQR